MSNTAENVAEPANHLRDVPIVSAMFGRHGQARLSVLGEANGGLVIPSLEFNTIVATDEGASHFRMAFDGPAQTGAVLPGMVAMAPEQARLESDWENRTSVQTVRIIEFPTSIFQDYLPELPVHRISQGHLIGEGFGHRPELGGLVRVLTRELDPAERRGRLYADAAMRLFLLEIASRNWAGVDAPRSAPTRSDASLDRAIDFIHDYLGTDLSLTDIAAAAGMSPTRLTRAFRDATGRTPYGYVIDQRIARAVRLLRTTAIPIAVIAVDCGFADQAHMTRLFRERLGITPGAVRRG